MSLEQKLIQAAIKKLQPKMVPILAKVGLEWEDFKPLLDEMDTVKKITAIASDPNAAIKAFVPKSIVMGIKLALHAGKRKLEPIVYNKGLDWTDVISSVRLVSNTLQNPDEIKAALMDFQGFITNLSAVSVPIAIKLALHAKKGDLEAKIIEKGLTWKDLRAAMQLVCGEGGKFHPPRIEMPQNPDKDPEIAKQQAEAAKQLVSQSKEFLSTFKDAITDFGKFVDGLAADYTFIAVKMELHKIKPDVEADVEKCGLEWEDILLMAPEMESAEEVTEAKADFGAFLLKFAESFTPIACKMAISKVADKVRPTAEEKGFEWKNVVAASAFLDSASEVEAAADDPAAYLEKLDKPLAIVALKPLVDEKGWDWFKAAEALKEFDLERLKAAAKEPEEVKEDGEPAEGEEPTVSDRDALLMELEKAMKKKKKKKKVKGAKAPKEKKVKPAKAQKATNGESGGGGGGGGGACGCFGSKKTAPEA